MTLQALTTEILQLKETVATLQAEMRLLRRARARIDNEALEALVAYIHKEFEQNTWTAADVFDGSADTACLLGCLKRCFGNRITLKKLSLLLSNAIGCVGMYRLECIDDHSRDGRLFRVTKLVTSSQQRNANVSTR